MSFTLKKYIIFLFTIILLAILVLLDPRSSIIASPGGPIKAAIGVALSYLIYGIDGFVGLNEIGLLLDEAPNIVDYQSKYYALLGGFILDFNSIDEVREYVSLISNKIIEAKNLVISNKDSVYTYQNDIGYVFYIILSFILFGIDLKSISILFLTIIILSSIAFIISFHKNNLYFFLLQTILFALIIAIIGNYGGSIQIAATINMRFIPILCIIPIFHLSIIFLEKNIFTLRNVLTTSLQLFFLIFLCFIRGTAMTGFIFLILFYSIWILKIGIKNFPEYKSNIFSMISAILLFVIIFNIGQLTVKKNLAEKYYSDENATTRHVFWSSLFSGIAISPKIHEKYVCSDIKFEDVIEFAGIPCGVYPSQYPEKSEFYKTLFYFQAKDTTSIHAALKYLHDNNLDEKLGFVDNSTTCCKEHPWNLKVEKYEEILQKLYIRILLDDPLEFLYMHLVIKPLKFLYEFIKHAFYFFSSFKINFIFTFLIFIGALATQLLSIMSIKIEKELTKIKDHKQDYLIETIFFIMLLAGSIPSIVFYPSAESGIFNCIVPLIIIVIFYIKKKLSTSKQ